MKPHKESRQPQVRKLEEPPDDCAPPPDEVTGAEESDFDEPEQQDADDGRWDVFILDDDGDPLPEYGDFWFPD